MIKRGDIEQRSISGSETVAATSFISPHDLHELPVIIIVIVIIIIVMIITIIVIIIIIAIIAIPSHESHKMSSWRGRNMKASEAGLPDGLFFGFSSMKCF